MAKNRVQALLLWLRSVLPYVGVQVRLCETIENFADTAYVVHVVLRWLAHEELIRL